MPGLLLCTLSLLFPSGALEGHAAGAPEGRAAADPTPSAPGLWSDRARSLSLCLSVRYMRLITPLVPELGESDSVSGDDPERCILYLPAVINTEI